MKKRFYKIEQGKMLSGVCGGLAEYFEVDPSIIRIVFALICLWKGVGIFVYIVAAIILPTKSEVEYRDKVVDGESSSFYE